MAAWRPPGGHLPLCSAFPWKNIALLLLFLFSLEQTSASLAKKVKQKPGTCPKERVLCRAAVPDLCRKDSDCQEYFKCCFFNCRKRCMDPSQEPCMLPRDSGNCDSKELRWYFDIETRSCKFFTYGGCNGNANNFFSLEDCEKACKLTVKDGQCPLFPLKDRMVCASSCRSDIECPKDEKCCESMCGFTCAGSWIVKDGHCPLMPMDCFKINKPTCLKDNDCPLAEKCCSRCGLKCTDPHEKESMGALEAALEVQKLMGRLSRGGLCTSDSRV
ncbi:PREDICTED: WAP four-disulfide core domain protein 8 [Condylura cristata]|uniref:WAP four-disulfide core domain protein 8 n=1 Tax=Condylura cristata TaxID=143302 RepID=UPI0003345972|nr:PREDICTED: WAP four-disulfide core domain protein 8 [Condylura cristata]